MPAPDESTTTATPEQVEWITEAEIQAALAAADWFDLNAPPELKAQY